MSHRRSLSKRLASVLLLFSLLAALCTPALAHTNAQVPQARPADRVFAPSITKTVGGGGDYATLKAAFDDINAGVLTGAIQLDGPFERRAAYRHQPLLPGMAEQEHVGGDAVAEQRHHARAAHCDIFWAASA